MQKQEMLTRTDLDCQSATRTSSNPYASVGVIDITAALIFQNNKGNMY